MSNRRLERTRHERASLLSCVGEPLRRSVGLLAYWECMKKKVACVVMGLATFVLGVVVSPIHFRIYSIACGPTGSSSRFTSSYFLSLVSSESWHKSLGEADAAWQAELIKADSVIEQGSIFSRDGERTGSRAVISSRWSDGEPYFAVVRSEKNVLHKMTCSSLAHVLAFEKDSIP